MKTKKTKFGFTPTPICIVENSHEVSKALRKKDNYFKTSCLRVLVAKTGFTIVELLTVMSIIALLLTILAPALRMVRRIAKDTAQRAQFHSIDIGLETYAGETEQYPTSAIQPWDSINNEPGNAPFTVGAHHLAEALLGRDMLGFDPWSTWDSELDDTQGQWKQIYASKDPPKSSTDTQIAASLDRRKGPYLSPDSVEAYQIAQLYTDAAIGTGEVYPGNLSNTGAINNTYSPAPVLTDSYRVKSITLPGGRQVKAGSPILYYRANVTSRIFRTAELPIPPGGVITNPEAAESIYNSFDNEELLKLGTIMDQAKLHHFDLGYNEGANRGREIFYEAIRNPTITTQVRPFNQTSYILMSAGFDGIFGTPDDIYNFKN